MAETTLKIARELTTQINNKFATWQQNGCDNWSQLQDDIAALITEKLTPLVEAATVFEELIQESKGATITPSLARLLDLAQMNFRRELARIKGDK